MQKHYVPGPMPEKKKSYSIVQNNGAQIISASNPLKKSRMPPPKYCKKWAKEMEYWMKFEP
jgi:hypothetical protein